MRRIRREEERRKKKNILFNALSQTALLNAFHLQSQNEVLYTKSNNFHKQNVQDASPGSMPGQGRLYGGWCSPPQPCNIHLPFLNSIFCSSLLSQYFSLLYNFYCTHLATLPTDSGLLSSGVFMLSRLNYCSRIWCVTTCLMCFAI